MSRLSLIKFSRLERFLHFFRLDRWVVSKKASDEVFFQMVARCNSENARATCAEKVAQANARELREQVKLNAGLLEQGFQFKLEAGNHSQLVDPQRVQVLTQLTTRRLDLRYGLEDALLSPFAFNVAKKLVKLLKDNGSLCEFRKS